MNGILKKNGIEYDGLHPRQQLQEICCFVGFDPGSLKSADRLPLEVVQQTTPAFTGKGGKEK